jgi:GH24 family phage-related lysozyme (muramidase)
MSYYLDAAKFIAKYEGFAETADWDVNAYRIGHGSDTITFNDGTYRIVRAGDTTTRDNAAKDLARRVPEFEKKVKNYIDDYGVTNKMWDNLPANTKVALLSFAYNYGNIVKKSIREAMKTGDVNKIADAVDTSTINDMKGTIYYDGLRTRRLAEAALIRSSKNTSSDSKNDKTFVKNTLIISLILVSTYVLVKLYKKDAIPF